MFDIFFDASGQLSLTQRQATSPLILRDLRRRKQGISAEIQRVLNFCRVFQGENSTTSGIASPALCITTQSPMRMSFSFK